MRLKISVSGASAIDFGYYVLHRNPLVPAFKELFWVGGNVVDIYGKAKSIAAPRWDGGTSLYWGEAITSGHIFVEFDTIYDIWDCTLQGVWTAEKRDYNATVTGIWAGSPPELPLIVPEADAEEAEPCSSLSNTSKAVDLLVASNDPPGPEQPVDEKSCKQRIDYEIRGRCSGNLIDDYTEYTPASCVDGKNPTDKLETSYIGESDSGCGSDCTEEGYEEECCLPAVAGCVPSCLEYKSINRGGLLPEGGLEGLRKKHGDDVEVRWVYSKDGSCGIHTDKMVKSNGGECCMFPRMVVTKVDNWLEVISDDVVIYYSSNVPSVPFTIFLTKGADVVVNLYNWQGSESPWELAYTYLVGEKTGHSGGGAGDDWYPYPEENKPVFTKSFSVCG